MLCHESPFSVLNPPLAAMFSQPNLAHESVSDPKVPRRGRSLQCPWPQGNKLNGKMNEKLQPEEM